MIRTTIEIAATIEVGWYNEANENENQYPQIADLPCTGNV